MLVDNLDLDKDFCLGRGLMETKECKQTHAGTNRKINIHNRLAVGWTNCATVGSDKGVAV